MDGVIFEHGRFCRHGRIPSAFGENDGQILHFQFRDLKPEYYCSLVNPHRFFLRIRGKSPPAFYLTMAAGFSSIFFCSPHPPRYDLHDHGGFHICRMAQHNFFGGFRPTGFRLPFPFQARPVEKRIANRIGLVVGCGSRVFTHTFLSTVSGLPIRRFPIFRNRGD